VTTLLHDFGGALGRALDTFLLGFHNFMVTALGSCVKWPLGPHVNRPNRMIHILSKVALLEKVTI
jgi:hypothetical protein